MCDDVLCSNRACSNTTCDLTLKRKCYEQPPSPLPDSDGLAVFRTDLWSNISAVWYVRQLPHTCTLYHPPPPLAFHSLPVSLCLLAALVVWSTFEHNPLGVPLALGNSQSILYGPLYAVFSTLDWHFTGENTSRYHPPSFYHSLTPSRGDLLVLSIHRAHRDCDVVVFVYNSRHYQW